MLGIKRVIISDNERALIFRNKNFEKILKPGKYIILDFRGEIKVEIYDITSVEFVHKLGQFMVKSYAEKLSDYLDSYNINNNEVGLVYQDGKLLDIVKPGNFRMYWKGVFEIKYRIINIEKDFSVEQEILSLMLRNEVAVAKRVGDASIFYTEVPDNHVGLLKVNSKLEQILQPGSYGYWKFNRHIEVEVIDRRLQTMEVSGQEILTKDRVSLRINLSANYRVVDSEKVSTMLGNFKDFLYREFQLALRAVIGTRTLDELLTDKNLVNSVVEKGIHVKAMEYGIQVQDVGIKDIILPGEMKSILNQVVEAQKAAEANLIKRREETQATRSLFNTAKMMEGNATLSRLKELEVLERITNHIDSLTVYGGLEGVMKDLVKIQPTMTKPS